MTNVNIPIDYRISKTTKKLMIAVGVLFDLMPMLLIVITMLVVFQLTGGTMLGDAVKDYAQQKTLEEKSGLDYGKWGGWIFKPSDYAKTRVYFVGAVGGTSAVLTVLFLGPVIYTAGSFISTFMAYLLFFFWFGFKRVNMWSFKNEKRILTNVGTSVIEGIPGLNILPGITLMVWIHIKLSRNEDMEDAKEKNEKMKRKLRNIQAKPAYT